MCVQNADEIYCRYERKIMSALTSVTVLLLLILCSYYDLRYRKLPLFIIIAFGIIITVINGLDGSLFNQMVYFRLIPGTVFLMIAFMTKQAVGYGDGMIIILLGLSLGLIQCVSVVFTGLVLSSAVSVYILIFTRGNRQTRLPFVPFLLLAWGAKLIGT